MNGYLLTCLDDYTDCNQLFTWNEVQAKHQKLNDLQKLYLHTQVPTHYVQAIKSFYRQWANVKLPLLLISFIDKYTANFNNVADWYHDQWDAVSSWTAQPRSRDSAFTTRPHSWSRDPQTCSWHSSLSFYCLSNNTYILDEVFCLELFKWHYCDACLGPTCPFSNLP